MNKTALVIDPDKECCDFLDRWFSHHQFYMFRAASLKMADEIIKTENLDLLLIYPRLPDDNAVRWLQRNLERKPLSTLPWLILIDSAIGYLPQQWQHRCLLKPIEERDLLARLKEFSFTFFDDTMIEESHTATPLSDRPGSLFHQAPSLSCRSEGAAHSAMLKVKKKTASRTSTSKNDEAIRLALEELDRMIRWNRHA